MGGRAQWVIVIVVVKPQIQAEMAITHPSFVSAPFLFLSEGAFSRHVATSKQHQSFSFAASDGGGDCCPRSYATAFDDALFNRRAETFK